MILQTLLLNGATRVTNITNRLICSIVSLNYVKPQTSNILKLEISFHM